MSENLPQMVWSYCKEELGRTVFYDEPVFNRTHYEESIRLKAYENVNSNSFWSSFESYSEIYIIDNYLNSKQVKQIAKHLALANCAIRKIVFICLEFKSRWKDSDKNKEAKKKAQAEAIEHKLQFAINKLKANFPKVLIKYCNILDFNEIHDRFAIMKSRNQTDVWHFGAAVANMHKSFTVATHGWEDVNGELYLFFQELVSKRQNMKAQKGVI